MAELSAAAPAGGVAVEQDVLLATKLHMPRLQQGFVARLRLVDALDEGLSRGLILVCAPAGVGKTAPPAGWARRGRRPRGWVSAVGGAILAARGRGAGSGTAGNRRAGRPPARPTDTAVVRGLGDSFDQPTGRTAWRRQAATGARRLPPDRHPAGARFAGFPAGTSAV